MDTTLGILAGIVSAMADEFGETNVYENTADAIQSVSLPAVAVEPGTDRPVTEMLREPAVRSLAVFVTIVARSNADAAAARARAVAAIRSMPNPPGVLPRGFSLASRVFPQEMGEVALHGERLEIAVAYSDESLDLYAD